MGVTGVQKLYIYLDLPWSWVRRKLTAYNDPPVIVFELVSPGAHLWSLDVDGWRIPCRTELGCCSSGMSIESALKHGQAIFVYKYWVCHRQVFKNWTRQVWKIWVWVAGVQKLGMTGVQRWGMTGVKNCTWHRQVY